LLRLLTGDQGLELRVGQVDDAAEGSHGGARLRTSTRRRLAGNPRQERQGATVELIEIDGRKIACLRAGSGHPLLLLHGAWSDGREWRPHLAGPARRVRRDRLGCGSDDPSRRWAWPTTATPSRT
jgi:pimeloyl-ACP methyl ester carboxylesterase